MKSRHEPDHHPAVGLLGGTPEANARAEKNDGSVPVGDMIRLYRGESLGVATATRVYGWTAESEQGQR